MRTIFATSFLPLLKRRDFCGIILSTTTVADPEFPRGVQTLEGCANLLFGKNENERIWIEGGITSVLPCIHHSTVLWHLHNPVSFQLNRYLCHKDTLVCDKFASTLNSHKFLQGFFSTSLPIVDVGMFLFLFTDLNCSVSSKILHTT